MTSIADAVNYLESAIVSWVALQGEDGKRKCLHAIKILNKLSKDNPDQTITSVSKYALTLFDCIQKDRLMNYSDRVIWIGSKVSQTTYYPVIKLSDTISSASFVCDEEIEDSFQPPKFAQVEIRKVSDLSWTLSKNELGSCYQDLLENCSFVSSILSFFDVGLGELLFLKISPNLESKRYNVILHFNGCERLVKVSDRLPFIVDLSRNIVCKCFESDIIAWPSIVEKAVLQVLDGGYNFRGSNMSQDTYLLTGWIPEIVLLSGGGPPSCFERVWKLRSDKQVSLGFGTGDLSESLIKSTNLIPNHDYAVLAYDGHNLELKNPWIVNKEMDRRFISLESFSHLRFMYINWNPSELFKFKSSVTSIYVPYPSQKYRQKLPQFSFRNDSEEEQDMWLLLERHLPWDSKNLTSLYIRRTCNGERVSFASQYPIVDEISTNNRLILMKLKLSAGEANTIVVSSDVGGVVTATLYHNNPGLELEKARDKYLSTISIQGCWDKQNNGGHWNNSTYIDNPQYIVEFDSPTKILIALHIAENFYIGIHMVHASQEDKRIRLTKFEQNMLLFDDEYQKGYQFQELHVEAGCYRLIASTYDHEDTSFEMVLMHDLPEEQVRVEKVSNYWGLFLLNFSFDWNMAKRFKFTFDCLFSNSKFIFRIIQEIPDSHSTKIVNYRAPVRGSIFNAKTSEPVQINNEWNKSLYGAFVQCDLQRGSYILLIERFETGSGTCRIEIGCDLKYEITSRS